MKFYFSEYKSDYDHYIFPYSVWAVPEEHEKPSDIFARGFLPNSPNLDRFYLCRHLRVNLCNYKASSENRRILRKGDGISYTLLERKDFDFNNEWREFCKTYADAKFGQDVMSYQRLDKLMSSPIISHVMVFNDGQKDVGIVFLYLEDRKLAFYYYSFYDLEYFNNNLGMYMMTSCVKYMHESEFEHIYLGSCYSKRALYKTQFEGIEFYNGFAWSTNVKELLFLIERDSSPVDRHLLENTEFLDLYYPKGYQNK